MEEVCDAFEQAWQSGQRPQIEDYLTQGSLGDETLLRELLAIELERRSALGEQPKPKDYAKRFPSETNAVDELFSTLEDQHNTDSIQLGDTVCPTVLPNTLSGISERLRRVSRAEGGGASDGPPVRFGDYELTEEIARGGMGVVYKARQKKANRVVALKMILSGHLAGEEEIQRFYAEAESAAALDHPNIVPIFDVGETEGQHFFSMGFIEGETLAQRIREQPLHSDEAADVVEIIAEAVHYAHENGIIHRDLKPGNVLLDDKGKPRVTDFGLAKQTESGHDLTATGQVMGTPSYMPPEQALGKVSELGPAADTYSLGAILYAVLTGRPPFQAANTIDTLRMVVDNKPISPRSLNPQIPQDLETICLKCLEKDPQRRYPSALELANELKRFRSGHPIKARPVSSVELLWRWCRRNPVISSLTLLVFLSLTIGIAGSSYLAILMKREAERADKNATRADSSARQERAARKVAEQRELQALLSKTELLTTSKPANGWSWQSLRDLETAAKLDSDGTEQLRLTNLAFSALNALDVRLLGRFTTDTLISDVAFSSDGETLFLAESKGVPSCYVIGIDTETLKETERHALTTVNLDYFSKLVKGENFQSGFRVIALSADGRWVAGGTRFGRIFIWDRLQPDKPPVALDAYEKPVSRLVFAPDGLTLYSAPERVNEGGESIKVWRFSEAWRKQRTLTEICADFCLSPDGTRLAGMFERSDVLETENFAVVGEYGGGQNPCFSADGTMILNEQDAKIKLFDSRDGTYLARISDPEITGYHGHGGDMLRFLGDTLYCVSSGHQVEGVRIYDLQGEQRVTALESPGRESPAFASSQDGTRLAIAEATGVAVYEVRLPLETRTRFASQSRVVDLCFNADSSLLASYRQNTSGLSGLAVASWVDLSDPRSPASISRWGIRHDRASGFETYRQGAYQDNVAIDASGELIAINGPLFGLHFRNRVGQISVPAKLPGGISSPAHLRLDRSIPLVQPRETESPSIEKLVIQLPIVNEESSGFVYEAFATVRYDSADTPAAWLCTQLMENNTRQWTNPAEVVQSFACGFMNPDEATSGQSLTIYIEDAGTDEAALARNVRLVSVTLIPKLRDDDIRDSVEGTTGGPVVVSPSGDQLWAAVGDRDILGSWSLPDGELLYSYGDHIEGVLTGISGINAVTVCNGRVAIGSASGSISVLDSKTGELLKKVKGPGGGIRDMEFASTEKLVVVTSTGYLALVNWQTGDLHTARKISAEIIALGIDASNRIHYVTRNGQIEVLLRSDGDWNSVLRLGPLARPLADATLSTDGRFLAYAYKGDMGVSHIIDMKALQQELESLGIRTLGVVSGGEAAGVID